MKKVYMASLFLIGLLVISSCQTYQPATQPQQQIQQQQPTYISKQQAEQSALNFIKVIETDEGVSKSIQTSYLESSTWTVIIIMEYVKGGVSEGTQVTVELDAIKGTVNCLTAFGEKLCGEELQRELRG